MKKNMYIRQAILDLINETENTKILSLIYNLIYYIIKNKIN